MSSTCFEHPRLHPHEVWNTQFYGISFIHPYKQSGQWQDVLDTGYLAFTHEARVRFPVPEQYQAHPAIDKSAYMDTRKKYHKTASTSLPEDENLDVRNMSKTL